MDFSRTISWLYSWSSVPGAHKVAIGGKLLSSWPRNAGPWNQWWEYVSFNGRRLRLASSAGVSALGTYLHCSGVVNSRISLTRFETNVVYLQWVQLSHRSKISESTYYCTLYMGILSSCLTVSVSCAAITASLNSSLGIDNFFNGATRNLASTKLVCTSPSTLDFIRR